MKLFIIGNGFDIDHGLKTRYTSFKEYLECNFINFGYTLGSNCLKEDCILEESANFIYNVLNNTVGDNWCNLEHALGQIDYGELYDPINFDDNDKEIYNTIWNNQEKMSYYRSLFANLEDLLKDWLFNMLKNEVKIKKKYENIFEKDALFLTFNYTDILERVYNVSKYNICHIHGEISDKIIFGHTNKNKELLNTSTIGIDNTIDDINNLLFKNCKDNIKQNKSFFKRMTKVSEIYILGWSISKEDEAYLNKIQAIIGKRKIKIYFTEYDKQNNIKELYKKIRKVQIFNISVIDYI